MKMLYIFLTNMKIKSILKKVLINIIDKINLCKHEWTIVYKAYERNCMSENLYQVIGYRCFKCGKYDQIKTIALSITSK